MGADLLRVLCLWCWTVGGQDTEFTVDFQRALALPLSLLDSTWIF